MCITLIITGRSYGFILFILWETYHFPTTGFSTVKSINKKHTVFYQFPDDFHLLIHTVFLRKTYLFIISEPLLNRKRIKNAL